MNKTVGLIKDAVLAPCLGTTKFFYKADILKQPKQGLRRRLLHVVYESSRAQAAHLGKLAARIAEDRAWHEAAHGHLHQRLKALEGRLDAGAGASVVSFGEVAQAAHVAYRDEFSSLAQALFVDELAPLLPYTNLLFQAYWTHAMGDPGTPGRLFETFAAVQRSAASPQRRGVAPEPPADKEVGRLKILYVTSMCPSVLHGGGLRIFDLLEELSKRHEVDLYCGYRPDLDAVSLAHLRPKLGAVRCVPDAEFCGTDMRGWLKRLGRIHGHYDFAEFAYPAAGPVLAEVKGVAKRAGFCLVECVTRSKALDLLRFLDVGDYADLGERVAQLLEACRLETTGIAAADRVFAVTPRDQGTADALGARGRSCVIPTGLSEFAVLKNVSPAVVRAKAASFPPRVAFVGYFDHTPNREGMLWYLEHVHPRVRAAVPKYRLRIIGRGDVRFVAPFAADDPSIEVTGEVPNVITPLRDARVCISPLVSGAGIRGKINQYAAAGKPTVTTSIGVCGTPYKHGTSVLVADAPEAFAAAIVSLLTDETLWVSLRDAARQVAERHFMWPAITKRVEVLYGE
jgi:glycosyltransferase involved in cell wall biosynthesis